VGRGIDQKDISGRGGSAFAHMETDRESDVFLLAAGASREG